MKRIFTNLFVAVLLMLSSTSWAQTTAQTTLEAGKVYNFKNVEYGKSMASVGTEKTAIADTDLTDYTQLWYVGEGSVDGTYTLRSLGNGLYLQGNGAGSKWPFVEQASNLYHATAGDGFSMTASSEKNPASGYWMHYGAGNYCVVGWDANSTASQWLATEVNISESDLQANWDEVEFLNGALEKVAVYQTYLDNLFFDKSCTTPKKLLSSVSDIENDIDYRALPAGLQAMVKKVYLGEWSEKNIISEKLSWSSEHAKRFRVQLYEPYSYGERTNSMLGIYAHSNMNNPTGLVANQRNLLYVMVEGEIKEGARLYLQSLVGDGRIGDIGGVELTEGLNIIPYWSDGNQLFIQYVVNTYENGAKTGHKLSQYEPLKIHIQGGCINGCFDTVGDALNPADTDEDWDAYEERAHQYNFTVLGKYVMWHMPLVIDDSNADYYDLSECLGTDATSVKTAMGAWETIESAQRLMEGLLSEQEVNTIPNASRVFEYTGNDSDELYPSDYSEEYNNRSMAYSTKDGYFMFAADWSTHYASNTLDDVILNIATAGDPWGPSHEIGHTYQGPINLPSTSETSNNAIANVSNWFLGRTSSRLGSTQSLLEQYNNNTSFLGTDINSGNVWEKLMMYTKLWFYYHVTGHNKKFYPRLFEMLRRDPIVREKGVALSGNETMLKFYKYACLAAGEDLTDFFEVFGFFVPVDGTLSDDYGDFKTVMTQTEIDAAKAEVAAMAAEKGWKKNTAIIFIDDRIGTVYSHDGQTVLQPRGDGGNEQGVLGSINDFDSNPNNDVAPLSGEYSYTISGNTITMQGATGGVGFIIYDADGNLVSFSNTYSFPLGEKAQAALASGTARVVVTTADIDAKPIEIHDANATQTQAELLEGLLSQVQELLVYEDVDGTKVGWYKSSALEALKKAYKAASDVYDAKELASYGGVYSVLYEEYNAVTTSPAAKTEFVDGRTYYLKNVDSGRYMTVDGDNVMATTTPPTAASTASLWQINAGFYESFYSIKNQSTGTYIRQPQKGNNDYVNSQQFVLTSSSQEFMFEEVSTGKFAIKDRGSKKYLNYHASGSIIATWGASNEGSQWEIVYLPTDETMEQRTALEDLMLQAQLLVDEVSNSEVVYEELPLQVTEPDGQYYLWTNAQDAYEGDIKYLIDNETGDTGGKFFHSDYHNSSKPAGYHYLEVYLGADNTNSIFKFAYTNRNNGSNHPDGIAVKVSNTKDDYQNGTIVYEVLSGLPQGQGKSWSSDVFATGEAYKYLHFKITADNTYWHMDEFDIYTPVVSIELFNDYSSIGEGVVKDVINAMMNNTILLSENDLTSEQLKEAYNELLDVYKKLLDAKSGVDNSALNAEKERLQDLIDATNELIAQVGEATVIAGANVDLLGKLYAENPYTAGGTSHSDYSSAENGYNLLDGNVNTHFHSDYNFSTMVSLPYLRVDLGKGNSARKVNFNYTTRNAGGCAPKIINVYGGVAGVEYSQGAIQSSAALNAVTTPTKIVIKNLSDTNGLYFAGKSNVAEFNAAVLVWEPVTKGVAGEYYLRTTDAENGYIQEGSGAVQLGTKDKAQKFFTTAPSASIAESQDDKLHFTGESLVDGTDTGKLVRFVQEGGTTWLNCQNQNNSPILGNSGNGSWTVHNVYLVTETENDTPSYDATPIAIFKSTDASNPLPTGTSVKWTSADIASTKDYRFFKFEVVESQGRKTENGNTKYYFAISEFGFNVVGEYSVTINPEYQGLVSEELLMETRQEVNAAVTMKNIATSEDLLLVQIDKLQAAKAALEEAMVKVFVDKTALQSLYDNALLLYGEMADAEGNVKAYYESSALTNEKLAEAKIVLDAAKTALDSSNLQSEIDAAKTALQAQYDALLEIKNSDVTGRDELATLIDNMQSLFGEVADKTTVKTAIALQATDEGDSFYIWSNATAWDCDGIGALIDKNDDGTANTGTFFGTTWDGGDVNSYDHYIEVDLGVDVAISELSFDYTTRNSDHNNQRPTAIKVLGGNAKNGGYTEIVTLADGMPVGKCAKWEMPSDVALNSYYRYIRFAVATDAGYFNMSDFNLYAHSAVKANDNYSTSDITSAQLFAMNAASLAGIDARDKYVTEKNYNAALTVLQEQYNELLAIKNANVTERNSLAKLIGETKDLVTDVVVVKDEERVITMQCTDENAPYYLYCNADGTVTNGDGDRAGVAALVGDNATNPTHLHTTYNNEAQDDDLDHYLRLDMGENEAMVSFKFRYTGRIDNVNNAPTKMLIEGSNDLENFDEIATLDIDVPVSGTATYSTEDALGNGKAYRYIRFMVKDTKSHTSNNGPPFFVLSQFAVTACKSIEVAQEYASPNLPLSVVVAANNEVVDGTTAKEQFYVTQDLYDSTTAELQDAKDALEAAIALKNIPVKLTTDANNPVLYKIIINRDNDGNKRLKYDEASAMVAVDDAGMDRNQAWYFMSGDDPTKDILILPYMGEGKVLATNSFSEGNSKVKAVEKGAEGYSYNWNIATIENSEWLNITILNGSGATFYFSNHGGVSQKMGFYNHSDDVGSQFKFVLDDTDYSLPDSYYLLYNLHNDCGGEKTEGDKIGQYAETADYNAAYNAATVLLENRAATDEEYTSVYNALSVAFEALKLNLPVEGGLYVIKSANSNAYSAGKQIYVDANNNPYFADAADASTYIWQFEPVDGGFMMKSLHTQSYVSGAAWATQVTLSDDDANAKRVTIGVLDDATGQVSITVSGGYPLHAQNSGSKLVGYTGDANSASAWYIEEVGDLTTIKHTVTMSATFSSVMLGYNATVPAGVEAYNAEGVEDGYVTLVKVAEENGVIPANTPVILYRTDANTSKTFTYTRTEPVAPASTVLGGSLYQKFVKCDGEKDYYKLMIKDGVAKMYWMYKEFNAAGESLGSTNDGGHIKCSANKIYMALPSQQQAASFGMRFKNPETTGVDEFGDEPENDVIYDLQGRKLTEITQPGFYIINGKKVYVK